MPLVRWTRRYQTFAVRSNPNAPLASRRLRLRPSFWDKPVSYGGSLRKRRRRATPCPALARGHDVHPPQQQTGDQERPGR